MERGGVAADLAGTAILLTSSTSDYVTGQILFVDGG
jgi:enoyl-[acyl-carrier-protein] reductase (NADH)